MRYVLAGASGFLGSALRDSLVRDGHTVTSLVRHAPRTPEQVQWRPDRGELDPTALRGADAVICLSGAGVEDKRWTDEYKQVLRSSRIDSVATIARALATDRGSAVLVSASAVGYYGDSGAETVDEAAPPGDGFLARLCVDWEDAAAPARDAGVRTAQLRTGLVLARHSGLLARLAPLFKLGLGGRIGNGEQYWPWISVTDEIAAIRHVVEAGLSGPVNLTGPAPVTNSDFAATLGRVVHRPALLPVPGFALRIALGEFAGDVVIGQRAIPSKLLDSGFTFAHATLADALRAELR